MNTSKMILSLDGGGIRGAATTQFLTRVEEGLKAQDTTIRACVDLFAGTSTGSIIALALATNKLTISEINSLYNAENANTIFTENEGMFEIDGLNAPKYEAKNKRELFKQKLGGDTTISSVGQDKHVLVVTYNIEERVPLVIKSTKETHRNYLAYQVADGSSAAPTYFPTAKLEMPVNSDNSDGGRWLIDGGVVANNPTMCAISEIRRAWPDITLDQTRVLSVGTGSMVNEVNGRASRRWGYLGWFIHGNILDVLTDERIVAYQAMNLLKDGKYIRVNSDLDISREKPGKSPSDDLDDVRPVNIKRLRALGDFWFEKYGEQAISLLLGNYKGSSLDRIT